jgi:hypothetical protein
MIIYRLTPQQGVPVLRHAASTKGATSRGLREFPAGLRSVEPIGLPELAALAAAGVPLPVAARQRLEVYKAVQREKAKANARAEAIREKAREKVRAKREEERAKRAAQRAQEKAERAAVKKRKAVAQRRDQRKAEKLAQAAPLPAPAAPPLLIDMDDTRLPWES